MIHRHCRIGRPQIHQKKNSLHLENFDGRPRQAQGRRSAAATSSTAARGEEGLHAPHVPLPPGRQPLCRSLCTCADLPKGLCDRSFYRINLICWETCRTSHCAQKGAPTNPRRRAAPALQMDAGREAEDQATQRSREEET